MFSAFGLVWKHHGRAVCEAIDGLTTGERVAVCERVDRELVQPIDATDNGQRLREGVANFEGVSEATASAMLSALNPTWLELEGAVRFDEAFDRAVMLAGWMLERAIASAVAAVRAARVVECAPTMEGDARVLVLDRFVPWQEHVHALAPAALFVVFPSETGTWMLQCVASEPGSFAQKRPLPEAWGGLRAGKLIALTSVADAVFAHPARFIAGARSREGALSLATLALEEKAVESL